VPGAVLIVNPSASRVTPEATLEVERALAAAAGPLETVLTERPRHAAELAAEACVHCERLYVFSGDGGYNEVVNGVDDQVAVGFLPGGSTSVLPRALGLPRDPVECARLLARGSERQIGLGRVNGRRFTFSAGLGIDAELVRRVNALGRADGRRAGDLAFARSLAGIFTRRLGRFQPAMTVLGRERVAFALVANCDPYSFVGRLPLHVAPAARFELGLDLVAPRRLEPWLLPHVARWLLQGKGQMTSQHILYVHDANEIAIECDVAMPLQADGEDLGDVREARFEAERDALTVLVAR
jgi:diacylglycerol kinase family enzyme